MRLRRTLILFFGLTFIVIWVTYSIIVINKWNPYTMSGMAFLLIYGSAPSQADVPLITYPRAAIQLARKWSGVIDG